MERIGPDGLIDYEDERDAAIAWEFNLWRKAEAARFETELRKLEQQRLQALQDELRGQISELRADHEARLSALDDLGESIDEAQQLALQKANEYKAQRQRLVQESKLIAESLQKQIKEAEIAGNEARAEAEAILAGELGRCEQLEAQAKFFQDEYQRVQKKREFESAQFVTFTKAALNDPGQQAYNSLLEAQKELAAITARRDSLDAELETLSTDLQTLVTRIGQLRRQIGT
ncbi:hypothetical protein GMRT_11501 [Giardia muris]|uniref:Coiled-coil protein n=1 Tax=Giardia muris TaxID=5742 RepID=A0A4Z1SVK2_GIAMU|nr:hypothetical protein GMRT_11501 [Giardia muris]|eukprot:TNJ29804.1 hypothetical protein GMRT_11501 [Giardia muris]